ncbi:hypothetical protein PAEPH01_1263 [Pancytospora epiphaga]|nr:hypothetical protein PAEPH01_1263 [Pancytospora epiphaga]
MEDEQQTDNHLLDVLKSTIISAINGEKTDLIEVPVLIFSRNESIEDVSTIDLIYLVIPFVNMARQDSPLAACEYLDELSHLRAVPAEFIRLWQEVKSGNCSRNTRLLLIQESRVFSTTYPLWDDREWLLDLIKHTFCRTVNLYIHQAREDFIRKTKDDDVYIKPTKCYKIMDDGRPVPLRINRNGVTPSIPLGLLGKTDLLKRDGGPTMSLEEYSNKVLEMMRRSERMREEVNDTIDEFTDEESVDRDKLVQNDEFNDDKKVNTGNTIGMG